MSNLATQTFPILLAISLLSHPQFRQREQSHSYLEATLPLSLPYLESAVESTDLETSVRARSIVSRYYQKTADSKAQQSLPDDYPRLPWIDQLPNDYPDRYNVKEYYLSQAHSRSDRKGPPDWSDYRMATLLFIADQYRSHHSITHVRCLLNQMRDNEIDWIRKNGHKYNPALTVPK